MHTLVRMTINICRSNRSDVRGTMVPVIVTIHDWRRPLWARCASCCISLSKWTAFSRHCDAEQRAVQCQPPSFSSRPQLAPLHTTSGQHWRLALAVVTQRRQPLQTETLRTSLTRREYFNDNGFATQQNVRFQTSRNCRRRRFTRMRHLLSEVASFSLGTLTLLNAYVEVLYTIRGVLWLIAHGNRFVCTIVKAFRA